MLLDEPVHAIDSQLRETFLSELKKYLQTIETTTIYVTHNLDEAFRMTNKVAVMENGHIKQVGDRTEIFNKTQTTFVAKILGMNIFKGKIIKEQNKHSLIDINNITLWTTSKAKHSKENITIAINPEDITISTEKTNTPKATNNIPGVITEMVQMHSITQITVDIGFPVKARATNTEIKNLGITSGDKIYATFDPAKINIFSENT
jgi:ABC-type Fe3+/spermidine/putrescine transport system ATPase subunit